MIPKQKRQANPYSTGSEQQLKGQTPPPVRVSGSVKNSKRVSKLEQIVWRQLFRYLNSHGTIASTTHGRIALLRIIKSPGTSGKLERKKLLGNSVHFRRWHEAEQMLIEACDVLIAATKNLSRGAA